MNGQINYSDRIVNLLNTRPNPMYNGYIFKLVVFVSALLTSHGYIEITRDKNRRTYEFNVQKDIRNRIEIRRKRSTVLFSSKDRQ